MKLHWIVLIVAVLTLGCTESEPVVINAGDVSYGDTPGKTVEDVLDEVSKGTNLPQHTHKATDITGFDTAARLAVHSKYNESDLKASPTIKALQVTANTLTPKVAKLESDVAALSGGTPSTGLCPTGYTQDTTAPSWNVVCKKGLDEVVKVGDFWVDRYEMSITSGAGCTGNQFCISNDDYPSTFPDNGAWSGMSPPYACSQKGVLPSSYTTFYQQMQACAASGKHICTSAEWMNAAMGTGIPCNLNKGGALKTTGAMPGCHSSWGAFDMVGNLAERVADFDSTGNIQARGGSAFSPLTTTFETTNVDSTTTNTNGARCCMR